tara:strand:+ start:257 stop:547 length:291 start_codon:yes stop_codon:yes gene_type:complete
MDITQVINMTWKEVIKFDEKDAASRVQKTGYCRRCQKMVVKYQKCNLEHLSSAKTNCPMREANKEDAEKMAGAVSTTSAPSLFNVKYSNKEEDEDA